MKWIGHWSGIKIEAESEEDNELLEKLLEVLPKEAEESYGDGIIEREDENNLIKFWLNR